MVSSVVLEHMVLEVGEILIQMLLQEDSQLPELLISHFESFPSRNELRLRISFILAQAKPSADVEAALVMLHSEIPRLSKMADMTCRKVNFIEYYSIYFRMDVQLSSFNGTQLILYI